jgi:PAS domain S-box-containing protein
VGSRENRRQDAAEELRDANRQLLIAGLNSQQQADEALRDLGHLNALLEGLGDAVMIADATGRMILMNRSARVMCGLPEQDESGQPPSIDHLDRRRLDGTPLPPDERPMNRALRGEQFSDMESILVRPDGARLRLSCNGNAIRDERGQISLVIVVQRDVTELRQLMQLKDEYTALISHDLRTPLTAILGQAQLLQRHLARGEDTEGRVQMQLESIVVQTRRMDAMIKDLLESSRLETGTMQLRKEPVDLAQVAANVAEHIGLAGYRGRIQTVIDGRRAVISADLAQIERLLSNLLTNALKYSAPDTPVVVSVASSADEAIVSVADQGSGISPEDLPRVFERFARVGGGAQTGIEGVGLGLYIARLIVEAHSGRLWAESEVGKGSIFSCALPVDAVR